MPEDKTPNSRRVEWEGKSGMKPPKLLSQRGATQLGVLDVLTALVLLAILVWAAWMQFPAYHLPAASRTAAPASSASP